ncbi:nitrous oxide reductase accessory protein NosL [Thiopseudomonas acetoxidans]|uniref:Nitrous oxide reductase accessory protein NosL n=1 Tax=Thiopseudomonas acetoxidans TaxID=3041622 RepID=A0ABT7SN38_9GAMM|nr:nitrous oxide reductase accessory protein NosL [Thiopseudomonas sp. CY1220]MDM7857605.1 nitrous oxide reductase accessory protein NosL [Thiopseudomonas sp. CY1220]
MKETIKKALGFGAVLFTALWLTACTEENKPQVSTDPVAFHAGDECHVCGMLITEWPGAKGQSINKQNGETHKFCSTVDMFSWWLQPENKTLQAQIYVHDMAKTHWDTPEDEHLIDARKAWYVVGSDMLGAMGPSLVSYSDKAAAEKLAHDRGGRVISFEQIDLAVLKEIAQAGHEHAAEHGDKMQMMHGQEDAGHEHESMEHEGDVIEHDELAH